MMKKATANPNRKTNLFLKIFLAILIIYILFTMFAPALRWGYLKLACNSSAEAEISKIEKWSTPSGGLSYPTYRIYYRYQTADTGTVEGTPESGILYRLYRPFSTYQGEVSSLPSGTAVGDQVVIHYNSKAPHQFYAEGLLAPPAPGLLLVAASIMILLIYLITHRSMFLRAKSRTAASPKALF